MDRIDRRTFLATGIKTGAALAVIGGAAGVVVDTAGPATATDAGNGSPGPPRHLTVVGLTHPVGVDPDDVQFAWHVVDSRRGAVQSGYRVVVSGPDGSASTVWDSGRVSSSQQAFVGYGGPPLSADAGYRWTVSTADGKGRWSQPSAPASFTTGLRTKDWTALWLRPGPAEPGAEEYTYLRATRPLPHGTIARATAYVAAAHKYQLWVNGAQLDSGPSFCFPDEQYYQATDITSAVVAGRPNAVGILHHWYGPGQGRPTSAPGLLVQVEVHYADGTRVTLSSDDTWRTERAEWLPAPQRNNDVGDFVEWIDGRRHPTGWSGAGFDDHGWSAATVLGPIGSAPFVGLYAQRTRISEHPVSPTDLRVLPTGSVVIDFGKVYAGRPTVSFRHGVDGHLVPLHVGYTLDPDGSVSTTHNTQQTDLSFSYTQRSGAQEFEPYVYLGFRYLQIDDPGEVVSDGQVTLLARHAAMPDVDAATFSSSAPMLDAVWALCAHSGLYTSQEQFVDTPTREKGQFLWDSANESETVMRTYGEQNLSWQGLRDMARAQKRYWPTGQVNEVYPNDDGPQNYPLFTARYPEWVWRYYLSTGDRTTLATLLPTLTRLSDYLTGIIDPSTGLISGQPMSTNGDNQYGYDYETYADTTLNVVAVDAFRRIADVAAVVGDAATASVQGQRATLWRQPSTPAWSGETGSMPTASTGRHPEPPLVATGQRGGAGLRRGPGGGHPGGGRPRRLARHLGQSRPRHGAAAWPPCRGPRRRRGAAPHRRLLPGMGGHHQGRRDLHLGDLGAERSDRGQHVARMGLLGPGRHPGGAPRGHAHPGRGGRTHHRGVGRPSAEGAGPCLGDVPDTGGELRGGLADLLGTDQPAAHRSAQRHRPVPSAGRDRLPGPRGRVGGRACPRRGRREHRGRRGGRGRGRRHLQLHRGPGLTRRGGVRCRQAAPAPRRPGCRRRPAALGGRRPIRPGRASGSGSRPSGCGGTRWTWPRRPCTCRRPAPVCRAGWW